MNDSPLEIPKWMKSLDRKPGKVGDMIPPEITVYNPDGTTEIDTVYLHNAHFDIPSAKNSSWLRSNLARLNERVKYYLALWRSR